MDTPRTAFDPANELQRCAELLVKHWQLALPTAIASLAIVGVIFFAVISAVAAVVAGTASGNHTAAVAGIGSGLALGAGFSVLAILVFAVAVAMTLHAAPDVLLDRDPDFQVSFAGTMTRLGQFMLLGLIGTALALALCITIVGIFLLPILGYFTMYAPAAVMIGGESAVQSLQTSFRIARERVPESIVAWIGILLIWFAGMLANSIAVHIPIANLIVGFAIGGFTTAYNELVRARFYLALRIPGAPSTLTAPPPFPSTPA